MVRMTCEPIGGGADCLPPRVGSASLPILPRPDPALCLLHSAVSKVLQTPFSHSCCRGGAPLRRFSTRALTGAMANAALPTGVTFAFVMGACSPMETCAPRVFGRRDGFQVRRVATGCDAAKMVYMEVGRYFTDKHDIGDAVSSSVAAPKSAIAVSLRAQASLPNPARRRVTAIFGARAALDPFSKISPPHGLCRSGFDRRADAHCSKTTALRRETGSPGDVHAASWLASGR